MNTDNALIFVIATLWVLGGFTMIMFLGAAVLVEKKYENLVKLMTSWKIKSAIIITWPLLALYLAVFA